MLWCGQILNRKGDVGRPTDAAELFSESSELRGAMDWTSSSRRPDSCSCWTKRCNSATGKGEGTEVASWDGGEAVRVKEGVRVRVAIEWEERKQGIQIRFCGRS